jgi:hypothetical protein
MSGERIQRRHPRRHLRVAEPTQVVDLAKWSTGTRLTLYGVAERLLHEDGRASRAYNEHDATPECP